MFAPRTLSDGILALACARVLVDEDKGADADPWSRRSGCRLNATYTRTLTLKCDNGAHEVLLEYGRDGWHFRHAGTDTMLSATAASGSRLTLRVAGRTLAADVTLHGNELHVFLNGRHRALTLVDIVAQAGRQDVSDAGLTAPMSGKIIAVHVAKGARVAKGAALLVMEAMKMEHSIVAPKNGVIDDILHGVGDEVLEGAALVAFTPADA